MPAPTRRPLTALLAALLATGAALPACAPSGDAPERPRLVVLVVVDQLRPDLLVRYRSLFTGGLARILDEGLSFENAVHDHAVTQTAPGHATLATGVAPSRHGVVGNDWWERREDRAATEVYAVEDPASPILGVPRADGRSPENMLRDGLADWMLRADTATRILSLSTKDRAAIAMAGRSRPAHAYWFMESEARFVTSEWYRSAYPGWLTAFNRSRLPALLDSVWQSRVPAHARSMTRPDTARHEWAGEHTHFPHRFLDETPGASTPEFGDWVKHTPYPDAAVLELARIGVLELAMGADRTPDLLALGLSQTDYIGHRFGPLSREQLDNLLRLDRELGRFLEFLDRELGPGGWVLALSADHGVAPEPEYTDPAARLTWDDTERAFRAAEEAWAGAEDPDLASAHAARALEALPFMARARSAPELDAPAPEPPDSFLRLDRHSYRPDRVPRDFGRYGVLATRLERTLWPDDDDITTHGSPYMYDRRVPLAFLGPGLEPGVSARPARTVDVAPTLAALAGLVVPGGLDGTPLLTPASGDGGG